MTRTTPTRSLSLSRPKPNRPTLLVDGRRALFGTRHRVALVKATADVAPEVAPHTVAILLRAQAVAFLVVVDAVLRLGPGARARSPSPRNEIVWGAGNDISLKFHFWPEFGQSDLRFGILAKLLCRTQIVSSQSDGFLMIF